MTTAAVHDPTELKLYGSKNPAVKYAAEHCLRLHPAQQKLIDVTLAHPEAIMLGSADQINFLQLMCRSVAAKKNTRHRRVHGLQCNERGARLTGRWKSGGT